MAVMDAFDLTGKKALVTGGNRGIGFGLVQGLCEAGADVCFVSRDEARNEEAATDLAGLGLRALHFTGDVTGDASAIIDQAVDTLDGLDVLVNNAGVCFHRPALEVPDDEWDAVFDLNVRALWKMSQAAGAYFVEAGGGNIINIGSISSMIVNRPQWQPAYNASKAAVHQLTKSLAAEWAPMNIRVNAIAPGYIRSEMAPVDRPEFKARWIDDAPQQRAADAYELAPTLVYLASEASAFMTGSIVVIDGGYTLF